MTEAWIWPKNNITAQSVVNDSNVLNDIEAYFTQLYAPYPVVYFSRARLALTATLAVDGGSRPHLTFCQPFSSHCVLAAVSEVTTPTTTDLNASDRQIIYHQWGNKSVIKNGQSYNRITIEDSVDSLILSNDKKELFPNNAPYTIVSLPKIINAAIGALVICQNRSDVDKLLAYREQQTQQHFEPNWLEQCFLQESVLKANPTLVPNISNIEQLVHGAKTKINHNIDKIAELFSQESIRTILGFDELLNNRRRLPANLMLDCDAYELNSYYQKTPFKILESNRTYYDYNSQACHKVSLLPCHLHANW